jgi:hypothetical protein
MRSRALGSVVGLLVLGLFPGSAALADGTGGAQHQCRKEWSALTGLHGENGNPRGPVAELDARWDTYYATAAHYADTATAADCGDVIASYAVTWDDLESLQYSLFRYDPMGRLAGAEGNREHALSFGNTHHLSPRLERAFRVARRQAPRAAADLAPALAPAATVDPADPVAVEDVLQGLKYAARHSHAQQRLNHVLRVIGTAELDEE